MLTMEQQLRLLVGERIPSGGDATNTMFSDEELAVILNKNNDNLNAAAAEAWAIKAAEYAALVDVIEEGSQRMLSQRYRHAITQLDYYASKAAADSEALLRAARSSVGARSAAWAIPASSEVPSKPEGGESSPWDSGTAPNVRPYPLHRFNVIKS